MDKTVPGMSSAAELERNPFRFYSSPLSLQKISSFHLALHCWRQKWSNLYRDQHVTKLHLNSSDILQVSLPERIKGMIDRDIQLFRLQLDEWISYHKNFFENNAFDNDTNLTSKCLDSIICETSSRQICYKNTAKNLLSNNRLKTLEKFRIACMYCFEDKIRDLWPLINSKIRIDQTNYDEYSGECYWDRCLRNEAFRNHPDSVKYFKSDMYPPSRFEHFWNKLEPKDLKRETRRLMMTHEYCRGNAFIYILPKLKKSLLDDILKTVPEQIISSLARDEKKCVYARQIWTYVKNFIVEEHFFNVLFSLCKLTCNCDRRVLLQPHLTNLLDYIWISASNDLRSYILNFRVDEFFEKKMYCRYNGKFLFHLLKDATFETRQKLWQEKWHLLIFSSSISQLDDVMKSCFKNERDIRQFKEDSMMNYEISKYNFEILVGNCMCSEVIDYLNSCFTDEERVQNLRRQIIASILNQKYLVNYLKDSICSKNLDSRSFAEFNNFINGSFASNDLSTEFKEKFVSDNLEFLCNNITRYLKLSKNLIYYFINSEKYLIEVKQTFYETCRNLSMNPDEFSKQKFAMQDWQALLECCAPNQKELSRFKVSIPLDQIFDSMLIRTISDATYCHNEYVDLNLKAFSGISYFKSIAHTFKYLNDFLRWYFESDKAIAIFKLRKIDDYTRKNTIKNILVQENDEINNIILMWFFESDEEQVAKFNRRYM